jgi:GT2 family glycosyltransferase
VIPTRDRAELLERCLGTVFGLTTHPNFDVCVVDNGSKEQATFEILRRFERTWPGRFRVIRRDVPFNFPALVNAGVGETDGELVLLLNNDTEVLDGSWLEDLAGYAQRAEIGAVGALLLYPDGTVQHGGVILVAGAVAGHSHAGQPANAPGYFGRLLAQSNYAAVTAACLMVRREVFIEAGGFDEQLAVGYNDVDFCLRLHRRGYRNVCLGQVRLLHHESLSRGSDERAERRARSVAESHVMRERWGSILDRDPYYNPNLTSAPPDFTPAPSRPNLDDVVAGGASATGDPSAGAAPRWVGSADPALLVAGHSHRYAFLDHFNRSGENARVAILEVASNADIETDTYWNIALDTARRRGVALVIVWDGNQHNVHFLLESAERFSVYPASGPWADGRSRPLIPRSLFREFFAPSVERLRAILARSNGARVIVLGTPPPKPDDHVRDRLHKEPLLADAAASLGMTPSTLEVTPLPVRVELWRITQELLREVADACGAPFVAVPEKAFAGGALTGEMSYPDVTHANGVWAEIMVDEATAALAGR